MLREDACSREQRISDSETHLRRALVREAPAEAPAACRPRASAQGATALRYSVPREAPAALRMGNERTKQEMPEATWHGFEQHILHPSGDGARALFTVCAMTALALFLIHLLKHGCGKPKRLHKPYKGKRDD